MGCRHVAPVLRMFQDSDAPAAGGGSHTVARYARPQASLRSADGCSWEAARHHGRTSDMITVNTREEEVQ